MTKAHGQDLWLRRSGLVSARFAARRAMPCTVLAPSVTAIGLVAAWGEMWPQWGPGRAGSTHP